MMSPAEIDTQIAALYKARSASEIKRDRTIAGLHAVAGTSVYHRAEYGRKAYYEYTASDAEVIALITDAVAAAKAETYEGPMSTYDLLYKATGRLAALPGIDAEIARIDAELSPLEAVFEARRWSRFFLVTSSAGHVHSSMGCQTCRRSTEYGWMPELSGKTEADAVAQLGPALCSVCFPSAPVEQTGAKITKAQAAKLAA